MLHATKTLRTTGRPGPALLLALAAAALMMAGCAGGYRGTTTTTAAATNAPPPPPPGDRPPEAGPGEAWCRVWVPPEQGVVCETVCVKPATTRKVWVPPTYGTRPKIVCVQEPTLSERVTPAEWSVRQRDVMVCPPQESWQRICCPPRPDAGPGEQQCDCWTMVERPAVWDKECVPVCVTPERRCVEYTPAQYKVVEERYVITPGRCEEVCEPAQFATRTREVCVRPGRWEWRRNETCEVPACFPEPEPQPTPLPSLQVEMTDKTEDGAEQGIFTVGDIVRYDLIIESDESQVGLDGIYVVFTLPPELEFVSGGGNGVTVSGSGQAARSSLFDLAIGQRRDLQLLCRVVGTPGTNLLQMTASVRTGADEELVEEKESTTIKPQR